MAEKQGGAKRKIARHPLNVPCSIDRDVPAVFCCSECKKPFCEDCIGRETAAKTLCLHCAVVEESVEEHAQRNSRFSFVKKKSFLLTFLGVIAAIGITFNLYILYGDMQESDQAKVMEPEKNPQLLGISKCRSNLEILAAELLPYHKVMDRFPVSVEEIVGLVDAKSVTTDPISSESYIIKEDGKGGAAVYCPTPGKHGVAAIIAVPGKPAKILYGSGKKP